LGRRLEEAGFKSNLTEGLTKDLQYAAKGIPQRQQGIDISDLKKLTKQIRDLSGKKALTAEERSLLSSLVQSLGPEELKKIYDDASDVQKTNILIAASGSQRQELRKDETAPPKKKEGGGESKDESSTETKPVPPGAGVAPTPKPGTPSTGGGDAAAATRELTGRIDTLIAAVRAGDANAAKELKDLNDNEHRRFFLDRAASKVEKDEASTLHQILETDRFNKVVRSVADDKDKGAAAIHASREAIAPHLNADTYWHVIENGGMNAQQLKEFEAAVDEGQNEVLATVRSKPSSRKRKYEAAAAAEKRSKP